MTQQRIEDGAMDADEHPKVILLVEDDPGDQELIRRALADDGLLHDLRVVDNGEAALDYLFHLDRDAAADSQPVPDLILLDFNLPKLNGVQVLRLIKDDPVLRRVPVVVLSTSQQERDLERCYDGGGSSYVVKPVGLDDFFQAIRDIVHYWFNVVRLPHKEVSPCLPKH